jgi:hypothetical protein
MKIIKKGNKILVQKANGEALDSLDISENIRPNKTERYVEFSESDFRLYFDTLTSVEDENGLVKFKSDFSDFSDFYKYFQENIFLFTTSGGGGASVQEQEFTGFIEANMEQAFSICDIYPNKSIYELSAKITSSNLTNTATIFYNQKQSENNGFLSLLNYFIDETQNKTLLFFPQNCVNSQNKLQIVIKNNTNELVNFQIVIK